MVKWTTHHHVDLRKYEHTDMNFLVRQLAEKVVEHKRTNNSLCLWIGRRLMIVYPGMLLGYS